MMGNYFIKLRRKIIRANTLFQFIHQVTIEFRIRKALAQKKFKGFYTKLFSHIKGTKPIRRGFHYVALVMSCGWDLGCLGCLGSYLNSSVRPLCYRLLNHGRNPTKFDLWVTFINGVCKSKQKLAPPPRALETAQKVKYH